MRDVLNQRIKIREDFRPFAPSVLAEKASEYFENIHNSPYMLFTDKVREEKLNHIPAVVHVDGTSRLQTVTKKSNPKHKLKFFKMFQHNQPIR